MRTPILFDLLLLFGISCSAVADDNFLKFKLKNGVEPLEARVIDYDFNLQFATLEDRDGKSHTVEIADLAASDKRLIVKALEKQLFSRSAKKPTSGLSPKDSDQNERVAKNIHPSTRKDMWLDRFADAQQVAQGNNATSNDDKPILWFRVLGDLRGLM